MRRLAHVLLTAAMAVALTPMIASAGEKGWFGFAMAIDVEGSPLSPKLRSVKVDSVSPASPAAAANAYTVKAAMQKSVGEKLHLKVKHGTDVPRDVIVTAASKPAK